MRCRINMLEEENTRLYNIIINNRKIVNEEKGKDIMVEMVELKEIVEKDLKIIINSDEYEFI